MFLFLSVLSVNFPGPLLPFFYNLKTLSKSTWCPGRKNHRFPKVWDDSGRRPSEPMLRVRRLDLQRETRKPKTARHRSARVAQLEAQLLVADDSATSWRSSEESLHDVWEPNQSGKSRSQRFERHLKHTVFFMSPWQVLQGFSKRCRVGPWGLRLGYEMRKGLDQGAW